MKKIKIVVGAVFMMLAAIVPSIISAAASCGETVSQNTAEALRAVSYEQDETIGELLKPSYYSATDKLNKKNEIALRDKRPINEVTDEEVIRELNKDNVQVMSFGEAFADVQSQIGQIIQRVVDSTNGAEEKGADFFTNKILQNKEKLLIGLTYLERLYDFEMGGHNIRDVLLYEPGEYGVRADVVDWLIKIGSAGGNTLKLSNSANVFGWNKLFFDVTTSMSLDEFLEQNREKWISNTPMNEWFVQESRADIVERPSSWDTSADTGLYRKLYDGAASRSYILPLLTVSEDSVYVISTSTTITYGIVDCYVDRKLKDSDPVRYAEQREQFRQQLEQAAGQQREFIDLWYRLAKPEKRAQLLSSRIVYDSLRIYSETSTDSRTEWSTKFGSETSVGVREFITPLNMYTTFFFSDGMADGANVRYYLSKALTERGLATYSHELTHLLVSSLMLNGYGARDGMQAEVYTRGMFEPYELNDPPVFNLNLIYDRTSNQERFHNAVPGRFQDETDLQEYMQGILDVIYTLDYTEADVMLEKSPEDKKKWFHKLEQVEDTDNRSKPGEAGSKHHVDSVRELTLEEAKQLNTLSDLIGNSILVSRYEVNGTQTTGTLKNNGYYVVPLFSANYAGVQNDKGVSGDVMIRRQAFELLAEFGYYGGMVPYISNQYKQEAVSEQTLLSDTYILNKIFGGEYGTMADFKREMFQKRIEKVGELKPVTITWENQKVTIQNFASLRELMREAVESDLKNVTALPSGSNNIRAQQTKVELLKAEIFRAYLLQTDDFERTIYRDGQEPIEPTPEPVETAEPTGQPTQKPPVDPTEKPTDPEETKTPWPSETPSEPSPTQKPPVDPTEKPTDPEETKTPWPSQTPWEPSPTQKPPVDPTEKPTDPEETKTPWPSQTPWEPSPTQKPPVDPTEKPTDPEETETPWPSQTPWEPSPTQKPPVDPTEKPTAPDKTPVPQPSSTPLPALESSQPLPAVVPPVEQTVQKDLLLPKVSSAKTSQVIRWKAVGQAEGYEVYRARSNGKWKRIRTVGKKVRRVKCTGLKKGTRYKYYVAAYKIIGGKRVILTKSLPVYSVTRGGKYGNVSKLRIKVSTVNVRTGQKIRLNVRVSGKKMKKADKKVRYVLTDPSVAKVSKKGTVTGLRRGTCYLYCITQNGLYKRIKVNAK